MISLASGLNATDTLIPVSAFPARGSKIEYSGSSVLPGGQAATTVIACQSWGLATRYVGKLGDDEAANLHLCEFARTGVDARLITVPNAISPQSIILVDDGGERTVLCRRDERMLLQPSDLDREWIVNARALHVDGFETAAATVATAWARAAGIPVIADLDEIYTGVEDLIANIDYLIVSRDFPLRLTGERNLEQACASSSVASAAPLPPLRWAPMACWPGMESASIRAPPIESLLPTPPAPETSFMPDSSTGCFKTGRLRINWTLPVPPPPSTAPVPARAVAFKPSRP